MSGVLAEILVGILAVMMLVAAGWDLRIREIPNSLNAAIAVLAIPFWYLSGLTFWPDIAIQIAVAAALLGLFWIAFAFGAMGGGDVKMIAAVALWFRWEAVVVMIVIMSLAGGVLTAGMYIWHRLAKTPEPPEIPYGVAVAIGGLWLIGKQILN
jgi:prepilin peptidase CpaA